MHSHPNYCFAHTILCRLVLCCNNTLNLDVWLLQGGTHSRDLKFINAHLDIIGRCLVTSIAAFTACLWAARSLGPAAWPARGGLVVVLLLFLAYDHGQDFQYHGFYNWWVAS